LHCHITLDLAPTTSVAAWFPSLMLPHSSLLIKCLHIPASMLSDVHQTDFYTLQRILFLNHRIARMVNMVGPGLGLAQTAAVRGAAEALLEQATMLLMIAAEAVASQRSAANVFQ
jgi:hypothetical protein